MKKKAQKPQPKTKPTPSDLPMPNVPKTEGKPAANFSMFAKKKGQK